MAAAATTATVTVEERLAELCVALGSGDSGVQLEAARDIRSMLSEEDDADAPIQQAIDAGVVPLLVHILDGDAVLFELLLEATWALTNMVSATSAQTRVVVDKGAVPRFVDLLSHDDPDVVEQAVWALGNIAGDAPDLRDVVLDFEVMPALVTILSSDDYSESCAETATWALANMFRGFPRPPLDKVRDGIPGLVHILSNNDDDEEALECACNAMANVSDGPEENIQACIDSSCVPLIVGLLEHSMISIVSPALRCIGNTANGTVAQAQVALDCGVMPILSRLLAHTVQKVRKEACRTLSNFTAKGPSVVQAAIDAGAIATVINVVRADVKRGALFVIANAAATGSAGQIAYLVEHDAVSALAGMLDASETRCIAAALKALHTILATQRGHGHPRVAELLEECDAVARVEALQEHASEEVYRLAQRLLVTFFPATPDEQAGPGAIAIADALAVPASPAPLDAATGVMDPGGAVRVAQAPVLPYASGAAVAPEGLAAEGDGEGCADDDNEGNDTLVASGHADDGGGGFVF